MVVNASSMKRMKRRVKADLLDILSFPAEEALPVPGGPFRSNVRVFRSRHALAPLPSSLSSHLMAWQVLFRVGDRTEGSHSVPVVVGLDVVEEDVARSRSVYCDQCRVVGWSGHPVCAKRYHFIVRSDDGFTIGGKLKPCTNCGYEVHLSEPRCKSCDRVMTAKDVEDWMYNQLEDTGHLLHGVVHSNGFGHLLRVNGREGGSRVLSGTDIMDFWDRLCRYLGVRKMSVMDVSKKFGMEYRLLHAIARGHPWYGNWGYEFGRGSFALTAENYREASEALSQMPLHMFICDGRKPRTQLQDLILFYMSLSEHELVTIRDLFSYVLSLVHDAPKVPVDHGNNKKPRYSATGILQAWTNDDIKRVEDAMFRVLQAVSGSKWVCWRTLRGAVCKMGPPELLDYCLKGLAGKQAAKGLVVQVRHNPDWGALDYRLEPMDVALNEKSCSSALFLNSPSREHLITDLRFLYKSLLNPQTMISFGPEAKLKLALSSATKLLDCKQFVKDYKPEISFSFANPSKKLLFCQLRLLGQSEVYSMNPPAEPVVLPRNASVSDLKSEASKAFQDVYIALKGLQVEELLEFGAVDGSASINLLMKSLDSVCVGGRWTARNGLGKFRMERGLERWTVDCLCGAMDDDGERMLACDICGVWQHTRCGGIPDLDAVPARFLCRACRVSGKVPKSSAHYRDESVTTTDVRVIGGGGCGNHGCG